jgi:hypothetical protein
MLDDEDEIQTQKRIRFEEVSKLVPKKLVLNTLTMLILFFWMNQNQLEHPNKYLQLLQVIKFTSCLPMVGGSLWVLQLLPPLKLVAMILLKVALNTKN